MDDRQRRASVCCPFERLSRRPAPTRAAASKHNCVRGRPVNGNGPLLGGVTVGGGLSKVTPRTVGETDGSGLPPAGGDVVVPPAGGDVVLPPAGGLVVPLAGHALLLGVVVGNPVVAVKGTTSREDAVDPGLGVADGGMTAFDGGASALAPATRMTDAVPARLALSMSAPIVRRAGSSRKRPRVTQVNAHNPGRGCDEAVKRAGASRLRRRHNSLRPRGAACRL